VADRGHLFVVQADLTRLAADAFLIPCDSKLNVSGTWRPFVEPGAPAQAKQDWFRPEGVQLDDGVAVMPDPTPKGATPDQVVGLRVLVDTVGVDSIPAMVKRSLDAVRRAAAKAVVHGGRELPLVSMPILGVGQGKFPGRRAETVRELVGQLLDFVSTHPIDVALTLQRTADFAAAQWERQRRIRDLDLDCWPELTPEQAELADRLGDRASRGELSVFAGAGVSRPVGLPSWNQLLQDLSPHNELTFTEDTDYPQLAQDLGRDDLNEEVARRLTTRKHALGHALLVDLRTPSLVTTNYDPCLENAADIIHRAPRSLRVIARELVGGGSPWLLKLHGDVAHPRTIVLTRAQYDALKKDLPALRGVVQTLMLTNHLLFVGFGFADDDFLAMAEAVQKVRALAADQPDDAHAGTAIELCRSDRKRRYSELDYHHLRTDNDLTKAARQLEILLDRLAWRCQVAGRGRASYLLDPDYQQDAVGHDRVLAEALAHLQASREQWKDSSGARAVQDLMDELGWRPAAGSRSKAASRSRRSARSASGRRRRRNRASGSARPSPAAEPSAT